MQDSWWLKFRRAQRHMVEIRQAIRAYAKRKPYTISRVRQPKAKRDVWSYAITFDAPDPMIIMMLGDFIHNLRSSLDHVAVACSLRKYRKSASFPLVASNPFALDASGDFVNRDGDARKGYLRAIRGMSFVVRAMIAAVQPHRRIPESDVFRILSVLDNADKHRESIVIAAGLRAGTASVTIRGVHQASHSLLPNEFYEDGAQVYSMTLPKGSTLTDAEVNVECSGAVTIGVKVAGLGTHKRELQFPLEMTMLQALRDLRFTLRQFEKQAIR